VQIKSVLASIGYDSGELPLTFEASGRSLYYNWTTGLLPPETDYTINITLRDKFGNVFQQTAGYTGADGQGHDATVHLANRYAEPSVLAASTDAQAPAPGFPLVFRRVYQHNSVSFPYLGPLGRGWTHN
jgi:hypothetical protein